MATDQVIGGGSLSARLDTSSLLDGDYSDTHDLCCLLTTSGKVFIYKVSSDGKPIYIGHNSDNEGSHPTHIRAYGR